MNPDSATALASLSAIGAPATTRRIGAGAASILLHASVLVFILLREDVTPGDPGWWPVVPVDWVQDLAPVREVTTQANTQPIRREAVDEAAPLSAANSPLPEITDNIGAAREALVQAFDAAAIQVPTLSDEIDLSVPPVAPDSVMADTTLPVTDPVQESRQIDIPEPQRAMLVQRLEQAAATLHDGTRSELAWSADGRPYRAVLTRQTLSDSMGLEEVLVDITSEQDGASVRTQLTMKRLAFSQFSQVVDRWDMNVQLHDDEIIGRFHSNSTFHIGLQGGTGPKFSGKVTTAAHNFTMVTPASRRRRDEMFQGGLQTKTGRIELPQLARPFSAAPMDASAHVQTFDDDTHIVFSADGSYTWQARRSEPVTAHYPSDQPSYFMGTSGVTLFVKGTVNGSVLVYSPDRIVIEGNLVYATDPRVSREADDYLGLVSDRTVEIARSYVTGRGDLRIDGAIFARRRFIVSDIDHPRTALMSIYGSLTAGTMSASEPRYATKIEFDPRFDRRRPPGFPATNRYEVADWAPAWREARSAPQEATEAALRTVESD